MSYAALPSGVNATGIISVSINNECEAVDITHRGVTGDFRQATGGFTARTYDIECLDASAVMTALATGPTGGYQVMSVTESQPLDGPVTYTVTVRPG